MRGVSVHRLVRCCGVARGHTQSQTQDKRIWATMYLRLRIVIHTFFTNNRDWSGLLLRAAEDWSPHASDQATEGCRRAASPLRY